MCAYACWLFVCPVLFSMSWTPFWKLLELLRPSASLPLTGNMADRGHVLPRSERCFFFFLFVMFCFSRPKYCLGKEVHICDHSTALYCFWVKGKGKNYIYKKRKVLWESKDIRRFFFASILKAVKTECLWIIQTLQCVQSKKLVVFFWFKKEGSSQELLQTSSVPLPCESHTLCLSLIACSLMFAMPVRVCVCFAAFILNTSQGLVLAPC